MGSGPGATVQLALRHNQRPSTNSISISSRKDPGGPGDFFPAPMGCNQSNVGWEQQCPTMPYRLMVITARQPGPGEANPSAPATENDSRRASVGSRRQVRFSLRRPSERRLPSRSPVGLARLRASADWATPGLGRHGACELQRETRTLPTFVSVWSPLRLCGRPGRRLWPLIGPAWWRRCAARLEHLFKRKRAASCARRIRRARTSTPHLIGDVLKTNYVTAGALCFFGPGTTVLGCGLDPDLQWPHDATSSGR